MIAFLLLCQTAQAEWQAVERIETYSIRGTTGAELYASIGKNGPLVGGKIRAIAHTRFKLTWSRKYERKANACALVTAHPKLIIIFTFPKPANALPAPTKKNWETFIAGLRDHERVHADSIVDLVRDIEAATVGLLVEDDPGCRKIKSEMKRRLSAISQAQKQRSRQFDQAEMGDGGNVRNLVLGLVNGG